MNVGALSCNIAASTGESGQLIENATLALANSTLELPLRFRFRWRDIEIQGEVSDHEGHAVLRQSLDLEPVPYSAENPSRRRHHHDLLGQPLPVGCFVVGPGRRLTLRLERALEAPFTGGGVVVAATAALLEAAPYLSLVGDRGRVGGASSR
jgi:hypothetical protein